MTFLLDTTVLVYAAGDPTHPLAAPARLLLRRAATTHGHATTTPEVVQEFVHVRARRRTRADAAALGREIATVCEPLARPTEAHLRIALDLFEAHEQLGAFGSVLAAVALDDPDLELVTADRGFFAVPWLRTVDLSSL